MTRTPDIALVHDPLDRPLPDLQARSRRALEVCDLLEALADDLPRRSAAVWRETRHQAKAVLQPHVAFVSSVIVPLLIERAGGVPEREAMLRRLTADYADLAYRLADLDDLFVDALASDSCRIGAESLGYALRGQFDALRQRIAWETDVLWPLAAQLLTDQDLKGISGSGAPNTLRH